MAPITPPATGLAAFLSSATKTQQVIFYAGLSILCASVFALTAYAIIKIVNIPRRLRRDGKWLGWKSYIFQVARTEKPAAPRHVQVCVQNPSSEFEALIVAIRFNLLSPRHQHGRWRTRTILKRARTVSRCQFRLMACLCYAPQIREHARTYQWKGLRHSLQLCQNPKNWLALTPPGKTILGLPAPTLSWTATMPHTGPLFKIPSSLSSLLLQLRNQLSTTSLFLRLIVQVPSFSRMTSAVLHWEATRLCLVNTFSSSSTHSTRIHRKPVITRHLQDQVTTTRITGRETRLSDLLAAMRIPPSLIV